MICRGYRRVVGHLSATAVLAVLLLAAAPAAQVSRRCLDAAEAARTWPSRALAKDDDGCWTYDHHPSRPEVPVTPHEDVLPSRETKLRDRWVDADLMEVELRQRDPVMTSPAGHSPPPVSLTSAAQFALFVALVLATVAVTEIATVRPGMGPGAAARRWAAKSRGRLSPEAD